MSASFLSRIDPPHGFDGGGGRQMDRCICPASGYKCHANEKPFRISPVGKDSLPTTSRAPPTKRRSPPVQVGYSVARQLEGLTGVIVCGTMPCTAACGPVPFETRAGLNGLIDPTDGRTIFTGCSSLAIDETFLWSVGHDMETF